MLHKCIVGIQVADATEWNDDSSINTDDEQLALHSYGIQHNSNTVSLFCFTVVNVLSHCVFEKSEVVQ